MPPQTPASDPAELRHPTARLSALLGWIVQQGELDLGAHELAEVLWLSRLLHDHASSQHQAQPQRQPADQPQVAPASPAPVAPEPAEPDTPEPVQAPLSTPSPDVSDAPSAAVAPEAAAPAAPDPVAAVLLPREVLPTADDLPDVLPVWLEDPPLLAQPLAYLRALGPLIALRADSGRVVVDEEQTVARYGRDRASQRERRWPPITPVWRAVAEPCFDLVLAVDGGLSMRLWDRLVPELRRLFSSGGAFRDLIFLPLCDSQGQLRPADALIPAPHAGRVLLLLLSDCAGPHWWDGSIQPVLQRWGERLPFSVLQVLPRRMWERTALGLGEPLTLANPRAGAPVARYSRTSLRRPSRRQRAATGSEPAIATGPVVPVISCDPLSLQSWSGVVLGQPQLRIAGFQLPRPAPSAPLASAPSAGEGAPSDPLEQWQRFAQLASPQGRELARLLAAAPVLTLPVMRLVKQALLPSDPTPLPMAEVLLGGLLQRIPGQSSHTAGEASETLQFTFRPGLRQQLLAEGDPSETLAVVGAVSRLVEKRWNRFMAGQSFQAFLRDPRVQPPPGLEGMESFGNVMADIVAQLGGRYQSFAEELRRGADKQSGSDSISSVNLPENSDRNGATSQLTLALSWCEDDEALEALITALQQRLEDAGFPTINTARFANDSSLPSSLQQTSLILVLLSTAYLQSSRCMEEELLPTFRRWRDRTTGAPPQILVVDLDSTLSQAISQSSPGSWSAQKFLFEQDERLNLLRLLTILEGGVALSSQDVAVASNRGLLCDQLLEAIYRRLTPSPRTEGTLPSGYSGYVVRQADQELYQYLKASDCSFVFSSRQMGKSSLRTAVTARLVADGIRFAVIDPQSRGTSITGEQWYAGVISRLIHDLQLADGVDFRAWWKSAEEQGLNPVNRFEEFIDKVLLTHITAPIVIFVEEVDNLLSLEDVESEGFFGLIRSIHERRTEYPAYQRLCFCFLGVATPYDLISGDHRSAFNIGHAVELSGLGRHEATPLLAGLVGRVPDPEAVLDAVLHWSGGQPFLTQKLLAMVCAAEERERPAAELVAAIAREQIIHNWEAQDLPVHLRTIRDRLLQGKEEHRGQLLGLVQQIQEQNGIPADSSPEQMQLRLTGLVVHRDGRLQIDNPIYAAVFTPEWVSRQLQELGSAIYGEAITAWLNAAPEERYSHLIAGTHLAEALAWARGKKLSPADEEFLEASRIAEQTSRKAVKDRSPSGSVPLNLFISYSHKDESLRKALGDHIAVLQREGVIDTWHDHQISAGQDWAGEINSELESADIILCLVSAGFLASAYCQDKELKRALERHDAGEALVIPVIVRPSDWESSPLGRLQALPTGAKPVMKWSNRDEAFLSIANGIKMAARSLGNSREAAKRKISVETTTASSAADSHSMTTWLDLCPPPRPRPEGYEWDVFLSYRPLDRFWTIALYDSLRQCGYRVFLDQFVLVAGQGLTAQLGRNLEKSGAGVLIWSARTGDSAWVEAEIDAMKAKQKNSQRSDFPFYYVAASLDGKKPPGLLGGQLYLDFSSYPHGPSGAEFVKLTAGLQGKPAGEEAIRLASIYDTAVKKETADLRALAQAGLYDDIVAKVCSDEPAYTTTSQLPSVGVKLLIAGKQYGAGVTGKAGVALAKALERFPRSVRLRQQQGLLLRRSGQLEKAQYELTKLLEESQRDTETLGMLAAVWADRWERYLNEGEDDEARDALEQSQMLYEEGFRKVPTDTYTGINAASKAAMLGDLEKAKQLAQEVLTILEEQAEARGGAPAPEYWERVTEPEALLLLGQHDRAYALYHEARVAHQTEKGNLESTGQQIKRLLAVVPIQEEIQSKLKREFRLKD